jgi:hypothetical protein
MTVLKFRVQLNFSQNTKHAIFTDFGSNLREKKRRISAQSVFSRDINQFTFSSLVGPGAASRDRG